MLTPVVGLIANSLKYKALNHAVVDPMLKKVNGNMTPKQEEARRRAFAARRRAQQMLKDNWRKATEQARRNSSDADKRLYSAYVQKKKTGGVPTSMEAAATAKHYKKKMEEAAAKKDFTSMRSYGRAYNTAKREAKEAHIREEKYAKSSGKMSAPAPARVSPVTQKLLASRVKSVPKKVPVAVAQAASVKTQKSPMLQAQGGGSVLTPSTGAETLSTGSKNRMIVAGVSVLAIAALLMTARKKA